MSFDRQYQGAYAEKVLTASDKIRPKNSGSISTEGFPITE
jgi:hypothetical protein